MDEETRVGRPRSEQARVAVLHAVDDLLVEVGYAALTMKGIAERAGVGRQTVYRWWSTKAEVLFEATMADAVKELAVPPARSTVADVAAYLDVVTAFLTTSVAGAGYRALVGEAQHDPDVATMMRAADPFSAAAGTVIERAIARGDVRATVSRAAAAAILTGPPFLRALAGPQTDPAPTRDLAAALTAALAALPATP